jgi:hypothetical protein
MIDLKKKKIIFFSTDIADIKIANFFKKNGLKIFCFHTNLISYFIGLFIFKKNFISLKKNEYKRNKDVEYLAKKNFATISKRLTIKECIECYHATLNKFQKLNLDNDYVFFIPSGRHMHHEAAKIYALKNKISKLYLNYSNIPGYIFLDPLGTDAKSLIFKKPHILKNISSKKINYKKTILKFKNIKKKQTKLPQQKKNFFLKFTKIIFFIENYLQFLFKTCSDRKIKYMSKKKIVLEKQSQTLNEFKHKKFAFFPMQITTDVQILNNYKKKNIFFALNDAILLAKKKGVVLYVKENPAENNPILVKKYLQNLKKKYPNHIYIIQNKSVYEIINKCKFVINVNSTVGLEAILNSKKVVFLGKSMYANFNKENLARYLSSYLVNFDYHNPKNIKNLINKLNFYINLN